MNPKDRSPDPKRLRADVLKSRQKLIGAYGRLVKGSGPNPSVRQIVGSASVNRSTLYEAIGSQGTLVDLAIQAETDEWKAEFNAFFNILGYQSGLPEFGELSDWIEQRFNDNESLVGVGFIVELASAPSERPGTPSTLAVSNHQQQLEEISKVFWEAYVASTRSMAAQECPEALTRAVRQFVEFELLRSFLRARRSPLANELESVKVARNLYSLLAETHSTIRSQRNNDNLWRNSPFLGNAAHDTRMRCMPRLI